VGGKRLAPLQSEPGEKNDLAQEQAELLARLVEAYDDFTATNGVIDEPVGVTSYPYKPAHLGDLIPEG